MDDDSQEINPRVIGEFLTDAHTTGSKMYALLTALNSGMTDVADDILEETIAEGPQEVKRLVGIMSGSIMGMITMLCLLTGADPDKFLADMAQLNSAMHEVGVEIVRLADESDQGGEEHPN
jgi:hypothetical protein